MHIGLWRLQTLLLRGVPPAWRALFEQAAWSVAQDPGLPRCAPVPGAEAAFALLNALKLLSEEIPTGSFEYAYHLAASTIPSFPAIALSGPRLSRSCVTKARKLTSSRPIYRLISDSDVALTWSYFAAK